jgi:hypothetical protein
MKLLLNKQGKIEFRFQNFGIHDLNDTRISFEIVVYIVTTWIQKWSTFFIMGKMEQEW